MDLTDFAGAYEVLMQVPFVAGRMFERTEAGRVVCYDLRGGGAGSGWWRRPRATSGSWRAPAAPRAGTRARCAWTAGSSATPAPAFAADEAGPWPAPVPKFKALESGEHPRLFFRKADLPEIHKRYGTGGSPAAHAVPRRMRSSAGSPKAFTLWPSGQWKTRPFP
jgi:hypothetical protein